MMNQTQKHTTGKKLLALLLALIMAVSLLPMSVFAAEVEAEPDQAVIDLVGDSQSENGDNLNADDSAGSDTDLVETIADAAADQNAENGIAPLADDGVTGGTTVIAGSDFQNPNGHTAGAETVSNILTRMQNADYTEADGFLFCGDYNYGYDTTVAGLQEHIDALDAAVSEKYSSIAAGNRVYVQGNHDQVMVGTGGLAQSGANDPTGDSAGKYGVFVINEDDYMWRNSDGTTIQNTANALKSYLDTKAAEGFDKPIFVLSHLPLHYSMRTYNDGDGKYANYIFDVLNEAGAAGLNIIFLYGHDHSNGWDDYLGGAAVYLAKGDKINIAQASTTVFKEETLNFTYMNAGFTGYYENHNGADDTLTMTVFSITDDTVTVERYDANGTHNLKSEGVTNSFKNESGYAPNTTVYASPKTITLSTVTPQVTVSNGNVSVTAPGLTGLTATKKDVTFDTSVYSAYASYDINPAGYTPGDKATVEITLDAEDGFDSSRKVTVIDKDGTNPVQTVSITNGKVTFTTNHFSTYDIAQEALAEPTERTYTRVTSLDELVSGSQYLLIVNEGTDYFMLPESVSKESGTRVGFNIEATTVAGGNTITGDYSAKEWTITASGSEWILSAASGDAYFANTDGTRAQAVFSTTNNTKFTIAGSADNFTFKSGNYAFDHSSAGVINGYNKNPSTKFYIYRLTSSGSVDPSGGDWVTISDGQGKTIFRLVNQLTAGKKYLIVNSGSAGSANAVNLNGTSINSASVTILADGDGNYIEAPATTAQWTYTNADKFQNVSNTGRYLRGEKNTGDSLKTTKDSSDSRITWRYDSTNGLCETSKNLYISSSFKMLRSGSSSNRVYIYEEATLQASAEYAKLTGSLTYTVTPGTSAAEALAAVKAGIDVVTSPDKNNETTLPDSDANISWTLDSSYRGEAGEYAVTISYKNTVIGTAKVIVPALTVTNIEVTPMEGTVQKGASNYAKTGSKLTVTYSDGSTRTVDVTLGMLSGNFNKNTVGDYTGLTVTYEGKTVTGYTLHVTPKSGNDYPEYPHEGAVRVGKTGEGINFQSSGIAKVELTATGVPVKKGADVIVMVDTSSSMTTTVDGSSKSRIEVLRESLTNLIRQFRAVGADGEPQDIRVAIADFNGYVTSGEDNTPYRLKSVDHLKDTTTRTGSNAAKVYTGTAQLNADAFVTAEQAASVINSINTSSGTNYDYAFDATYQLGEAILKENAQAGEERDLFVIFMSDGAPFQYNYFSSQSEAANWNNWLQGTVTDNMRDSGAHNYFYNGAGNKHRMAEAIKGDPNAMYTVIRKDSTDNYGGQQYMTQLPGLGATMYSIGFCLEQDKQITVASMEYVLKNISSDPTKFYYKVNTADELSSAFTAIGNEIAYAATNARFVDTMGANYDLQMASSTYTLSDGTTDTITPEITVQAYDIYTAADGVAASEIGKRKGTSTVLETVTFNEDGTQAFSDKIGGGATNILTGGVICANTFWYNTTGSTVSIDTNGDGTNDYNLAPETFYWKMGTINQTELALSYYVYLTGSMNGAREAGSYPTNESATLHYTNWLGNEAKKDTVSPVLAWKSANVSYAFYLVNENGEIIVNKTTGQTGSFANKVAVTKPVVYSEVLLNSAASVQADILASDVLPEGYALYDTDANYNVRINSNSTGGWTITKGTDPATTYVTEYGGDPTTELSTENSGYDYTHTVVWFAVKYTVKAIPDAVVVDYGLPVDIHVLKNDMFYDKGELMYVGAEKTDGAVTGDASAAFTTTEFAGTYGTATVMANASVPEDSVVRYTPANMQMNGVDKFSYAVHYTGTENPVYYYSTVTVIPAANIYYEDSFVTFNDNGGKWEEIGQTEDGITQQEDRPGQFSLSAYDANNVYGYDAAYTDCTTYSLGSAKKVTVNSETNKNAPTATFTFKGTGFDLISLTSNTTGTILVNVNGTTAVGAPVAENWIVDTYYGYTRTENGYLKYTWTLDDNNNWHATKEVVPTLPSDAVIGGTPKKSGDTTYAINYEWTVTTGDNALYQIPVIRGQGLEYGTYTVTITPRYSSTRDYANKGSYEFYLDAVRIYDPAGTNPASEISDAYKADGEGWPDVIELRNELINANSLNIDAEAAKGTKGIVFVDGAAQAGLTDYVNYGPNNEVYLAAGQAIAFKLNVADAQNIASIQLAAKAPKGTAIAKVNSDGTDTTIATATEMYYTITHRVTWSNNTSNTIVVANVGDNILSLTNLKITYKEAPNSSVATQVDAQVLEEAPNMLLSMLGIEAPVVEPEPAVFEPERFEARWNRSSVRVGEKAILTVKTSEDVEAVTVDGVTIDTYRTRTQRTGWGWNAKKVTYREFTYTITASETADHEITAVNAEGTASEAITATLTVRAAAQRPGIGGWLNKLFSRWF